MSEFTELLTPLLLDDERLVRAVLDAPSHPYSIRLLQAVLPIGDAWRDERPAEPRSQPAA